MRREEKGKERGKKNRRKREQGSAHGIERLKKKYRSDEGKEDMVSKGNRVWKVGNCALVTHVVTGSTCACMIYFVRTLSELCVVIES